MRLRHLGQPAAATSTPSLTSFSFRFPLFLLFFLLLSPSLALRRRDSHTVQFVRLNCTGQWFSVYTQNRAPLPSFHFPTVPHPPNPLCHSLNTPDPAHASLFSFVIRGR